MTTEQKGIDSGSEFNREYLSMQLELVLLLNERICWNDRLTISNAIATNRQERDSMRDELEHLFAGEDVPDGH